MPSYAQLSPAGSTTWSPTWRACEVAGEDPLGDRAVADPLAAAPAQVDAKRLVAGAAEDGQWLMYSGSYSSHRFSPLGQITPENVGAAEDGLGVPATRNRHAARRRRWSPTA